MGSKKCYLKKRWAQYNVGYNKNFMDIRIGSLKKNSRKCC